jgi:hypothetical protein
MKRRIHILIDQEIMRLAEQRAAEERRPVRDLIRDALVQYLQRSGVTDKERKMAVHFFCERPMKIPRDQLRYVLQEELWDL